MGERTFVAIVPDRDKKFLPIPIWKNCLIIPGGVVTVTYEDDKKWEVSVDVENCPYRLTRGWKDICSDLNLLSGDLLLFDCVQDLSWSVKCFPKEQFNPVSNYWFHYFKTPAYKSLVVPKEYFGFHFPNVCDSIQLNIRQGVINEWSVRLRKFWDGYILQDGWDSIVNDLQIGFNDLIFFEKIGVNVLRIAVYRSKTLPGPEHATQGQSINEEHDNDGDDGDEEEISEQGISEDNISSDDDAGKDDVDEVVLDEEDDAEEDDAEEDDAEDDEDDEIVLETVITVRFRFPQDYARSDDLESYSEIDVKAPDGKLYKMSLRSEKNRDNRRYAFKEWKKFMMEAGVVEGQVYMLKFVKSLALLEISIP